MILTIQMEHALHENEARLFLRFPYNDEAINLAKTLPQAKWSNTKRSWYIKYHAEHVVGIFNLFALKGIKVVYINEKEPVPFPNVIACQMESHYK